MAAAGLEQKATLNQPYLNSILLIFRRTEGSMFTVRCAARVLSQVRDLNSVSVHIAKGLLETEGTIFGYKYSSLQLAHLRFLSTMAVNMQGNRKKPLFYC